VAEARFGGLAPRITSALVLIPVALLATWAGGWAFFGLVLLAGGLMLAEWDRMAGMPLDWRAAAKIALFAVALLAMESLHPGLAFLAIVAAAAIAGCLAAAWRHSPGWAAAGVIYIGLPCVILIWLREQPPQGLPLVLWLLALVWATDSGAYAAGRLLGGPKLAPRISPNKTWAGLFGGVAGAMLVGAAAAAWSDIAAFPVLVPASGMLAAVAQIGDLMESAVKRHFKVKDAGRIIPGHGGALDRLDGMLFAVPVAALMLLFSGASAWR